MYKHVLIPTDGSALSDMAIRHGMALAKAVGARVTVLAVSLPFHSFALDSVMVNDTPVQYEQECAARAEKILETARKEATVADVSCDTRHVVRAEPYEAIVETAQRKGCDLICMSSHGRKGNFGVRARQRDQQGAHPQQDPGAGMPVSCDPEES